MKSTQPELWSVMRRTCSRPAEWEDYFGADQHRDAPDAECYDFDGDAADACLASLRHVAAQVDSLPLSAGGCDYSTSDDCLHVFRMKNTCMIKR